MSKTTQKNNIDSILSKVEQERKSRVIVYYTGEKEPKEQFATGIATDVLLLFKNILKAFEFKSNNRKISLILNTNGGFLETPWPLVNLIREYSDIFEVIVLEKALSAGTLISLGADKILMMPYSQLSPIDPAANIIDSEKKQQKHLEIEDIIGFIDFTRDKLGIDEQSALTEVLKELTKEVNPTLLGSINRTHSLIRSLSNKLLNLHKNRLSEKQIKEISVYLTEKLYSHNHFINRREAKNEVGFGRIIEFSNGEMEKLADEILVYFSDLMNINTDFNPIEILGSLQQKDYNLVRAALYSIDKKYNFESIYKIAKVPDPSGKQQIMVNNTSNKWQVRTQ